MTLRILFTLAILAGLAAAPGAQTFRWEPNRTQPDVADRVERALERAYSRMERQWDRIERQWERHFEQASRAAELNADRIQRQVHREVRAHVIAHIRAERSYGYRYSGPRFNYLGADGQVGTDADPCASMRDRDNDDYRQHCEVREESMAASPLTVDAGQNGGISVEAWDRNDIRVRAVVMASASTEDRARQLASEVRTLVGGGRVSSEGPENGRREWWSVSYRINVPRKTDLDLNANNGGITIRGVSGNLRFNTTNGGVKLTDLAGRVNGSTRNGGLSVELGGARWEGDGIDVETSNGGVTVAIPDGYNAQLETRTVNGGFRSDIPLTIQGELSSRRGISTTLGSGGPMVRVRTTNGGLKIARR